MCSLAPGGSVHEDGGRFSAIGGRLIRGFPQGALHDLSLWRTKCRQFSLWISFDGTGTRRGP